MPTGLGGEVAWYCPSLDTSGNGTTTLTDFGSGGNDGTLTNMDAASDWVSDTTSGGVRALDFDGTNDYITTSNVQSFGSNDFSISAWIRWDGNGVDDDWISNRALGAVGSGVPGLAIGKTGDTVNYRLNVFLEMDNSAYFYEKFNSYFSDGVWFHFLCTWDNSTGSMKVYKDGTLKTATTVSSSGTTAGQTCTPTSNFVIGARPSTTTRCPNGRMDDLRIYHRILSSSEITNLSGSRGYEPEANNSVYGLNSIGFGGFQPGSISRFGVCES